MLKLHTLHIPDIFLIVPERHGDERGFFSETYNHRVLRDAGMDINFVQDNHSYSIEKGVLRGLHFQTEPEAQGKLVRVTRGAIFDVAVDIRQGSPTFGKYITAQLSAENWHQLWIPVGFAHGFCTTEPDTEVLYKTSNYYAPECDTGIAWNDPDLNIPWPVSEDEVILSSKDQSHLFLKSFPLEKLFSYRSCEGCVS